jgi:hypothetical protein
LLSAVVFGVTAVQAGTTPAADRPLGTLEVGGLDADAAGRFAALALSCLHREYPNKIAHVLAADQDARPPRQLHPAFYGCYDWHSAVHAHWLLVRLTRLLPEATFAPAARLAVGQSLVPDHIAAEVAYLETPGRASWERPYGLAWLLQLAAELREWDDPDARRWATTLEPLERAAARRIVEWVPKLGYPIRVGEHDQTAFAFGLILDWARVAGDTTTEAAVVEASRRLYLADVACPLAYEPSGQDFLSPCLAQADLMRRVLPAPAFAEWLRAFLPQLPVTTELPGRASWLPVAEVSDRSDPKLAHLDGLNLSRAWMLEGIAAGLPADDPRIAGLLATARAHRDAALPHVTGEHYEGGHWLGSFATYLVSGRGLR